MAPVVKALSAATGIESKVCVTAQHREMLDQVLTLFDIVPDIDLDLMKPNQSLAELSAEVFLHLDPVVKKLNPDWILVQGDTTTVMVASLVAYYNQVQLGHVEAGLRTGDKWQPFPEEINRKIAGVVADLHFAPTETNRQNLLREGVPANNILITGNTVVDALQSIVQKPAPDEVNALLERMDVGPGRRQLVLVTAHRRESFGAPLENICLALRQLAEKYTETVSILYPVHLNPNVQEPVYRLLGGVPNITLVPPLDYLPMVHMQRHARLVLTDSGGIQEEATSLGVPTLVLRDLTERPEGVEAGVLKLVGSDPRKILAEASRLLDEPFDHARRTQTVNPFGDGHAAERIVQALLQRENNHPL
jgi:UDP-N-acetylglucosamine 2-epimerase (non-hydrolysing)